ncbi:NADH:ubiquinone oxidoreductase [Rhizobium sp. Root149]|uniref:(2Fe-2S) ferredoxin domain-containing protein n=1 Tax=Rhizobium sp. Root149 TaxID=1736473 RepID=UPI00071613AC|nr:(2Fe-2S) ferredoxin domain-containing protein [Rhizobium sp. Root149]KQZ62126.1 NADH:ubiquinone oxidoreductase [Rhizobium sp. Root149]
MTTKTGPDERRAVLLIAKSAFAAAPHADMARLTGVMAEHRPDAVVRYAFIEQGTPSLKEALLALVGEGCSHVSIAPLVLPMEPSFPTWLQKVVRRWRNEDHRPWPEIALTAHIAASPAMAALLADLVASAKPIELAVDQKSLAEGSLVPDQKRRVLVCQGGPCNGAGADAIWCHLRNEQQRLKLRTTGEGTMTAKSTCLGPCNLAPVVQVFPEGTYYGGVTEAAVDRIITEHLLGGTVVEDFAYHPTGRKQRLRPLQTPRFPNP